MSIQDIKVDRQEIAVQLVGKWESSWQQDVSTQNMGRIIGPSRFADWT
jgi:hypothetical protein